MCPYRYNAIRNTNRFGILSVKCEQHGKEQRSEKSKIFPVKVLSLFLSTKSYFSLPFWLSLTLILFVFHAVDTIFLVFGLL